MKKDVIVPVKGYEDFYGATADGRVFSFNYRKTGKIKELAQSVLIDHRRSSSTYYKRAKMYFINKHTPIAIHRIIALTFIPNPNNYKQVNHIDGDKGNNCASNLEWCNNSMNQLHAHETGMRIYDKGTEHHNHKLTELEVIEIKKLLLLPKYKGQLTDIAKKYGVTKHCIFDIKRGKSWAWLI